MKKTSTSARLKTLSLTLSLTLTCFSLCLLLFSCGGPGSQPWVAHPISDSPSSAGEVLAMELLDLDQDGSPELLVSRQDSEWISLFSFHHNSRGEVTWSEARLKGVFSIHDFHLWKSGSREAPQLRLVAAAGQPSGQVIVADIPAREDLLNVASWHFEAIPVPAGDWTAVHAEDFNNDGVSDLALAGRAGNAATESAPEVIWMSLPETDQRAVVNIGFSAAPLLLYAEDVEGDGDMDLWVVDSANGAGSMGAYWLENPWPENPDVTWKRNFITLSSLAPMGGTVVDFDGDKRQDLLLCLREKNGANRLMCFKKVTAATESAWLPLPFPISGKQGVLTQIDKADLNRDGFPDLVLGFIDAADPMEHLIWLRNPSPAASSPTWVRQVLAGQLSSATKGIQLTDVDGDGDPDLISADSEGHIRWYENPFPQPAAE